MTNDVQVNKRKRVIKLPYCSALVVHRFIVLRFYMVAYITLISCIFIKYTFLCNIFWFAFHIIKLNSSE